MIFPNILRGDGSEADFVVNRARIPRLAHAIAIHVTDAHIGDHLRRRHGDGFYFRKGVHTVCGQPVVEPHGVRTRGKGLRKGVLTRFFFDERGEAGAVLRAFIIERFGKRNRLTVVVQVHQDGHVLLLPADAHLHTIDQTVEHMRSVVLAIHEFVAHGGPGGLFTRGNFDAVFFVEAFFSSDHDGGAIGERNKTDLHIDLLWRIGTGSPRALADRIRHQAHDASGADHRCALLNKIAATIVSHDYRGIGFQIVLHLLLLN